jgi:hypothetical protein
MKHNCKIKDNSLNITVHTKELTKINKLSRTIVNIKQRLRKLINAPDRVRIIKLSNHIAGAGKKDLNKAILTEINSYKGKQVIKVRTDINSRMLKPL